MRARTHSAALLPATSMLGTAIVTIAWWATMMGVTTPTTTHIGVAVVVATTGIAVVAAAAEPHIRSVVARWALRRAAASRQVLPPGVALRWDRVHRTVRTLCTSDLGLNRVALARAPGRDSTTT